MAHEGWSEATADVVVDFAEVAVHALLHARKIYPKDIFERRRKYGVPVWMSRHPELNEYICQVLLRTKTLMARGVVRTIVVCMFEEDGHRGRSLLEKVELDVSFGHDEDNQDGGRRQNQQQGFLTPTILQVLEDQLRSAILQIEKSAAHLPSRHGCKFALHVEAHNSSVTDRRRDQKDDGAPTAVQAALKEGNWLLVESDASVPRAETGQRQLVPIKSVRGAGLKLDLSAHMGDYLSDGS